MLYYQLLGCTGTLRLANYDGDEAVIASSSYVHINKSRAQVKKSSKYLKSKSRRGFALVTMEGNCCWKVREKRSGGGTNELLITSIMSYEPGWTIRSCEVMDPCQR